MTNRGSGFSGESPGQRLTQCQQAVDAIQDAVFVHDPEFRVVWANAAYLALTGKAWEAIAGRPYWEGFPLGSGPMDHCLRALATGGEEEETLTLGDGSAYRSRSFPLPDSGPDGPLSVHILEDRTQDQVLARVRQREREQLSYILANTAEGILVVDTAGTIRFANRAAGELLDRDSAALTGQAFGVPTNGSHPEEVELPGDGRPARTVEMRSRQAEWEGQPAWVLSIHDITERKRREQELRQSATVFEHTAEGIIITDPDQRIQAVNGAFTRITGYPEAEVIGRTPRLLNSGMQGPAFYQALWASLAEHGAWEGEIWNRRKNGQVYPEWLTISEVRDELGYLTNYVAVFSDITKARETEEELRFLTYHDPLTRLPNRSLFRERVDHALATQGRHQRHLAVAILDLQGFGALNDSLGPEAGDRVLHQVGERLAAGLREGDTVARPGGDEFWVLLEDLRQSRDAERVVRQLLAALREPVALDGQTIRPEAQVGIALAPDDAGDVDTLLTQSATALHRAQAEGGSAVHFFQPEFGQRAGRRFRLEEALKLALEREELEVWYQPQVDTASEAMVGVEALVRWRHPEWGLVSPGEFIPVAEEAGLILPLGEWVLARAVSQGAEWRSRGVPLGRVGVNVAAAQLQGGDLSGLVATILERTGLAPDCLELEVTEEGFLSDLARARETLAGLKAQGVRLAIDDFGTGYSSLAYLKTLDVDTLKVDKSFIDGLPEDANDASIVQAVQAVAQTLGLVLLAEGVETPAQAAWLRAHGIQQSQGFLYGRPMPAAELEGWLAQGAG